MTGRKTVMALDFCCRRQQILMPKTIGVQSDTAYEDPWNPAAFNATPEFRWQNDRHPVVTSVTQLP